MADDAAARLAAIKRARDSGVLTVRHGDTQTTFRSLLEMEAIISSLQGEIDSAGTGTAGKRTRLRYPLQMTKGL